MPVKLVERVIAGVVVGLVIENEKPLALTPLTFVTVPAPEPVAAIVIFEPEGVIVIPVPGTKVRAPVKELRLVTPPPPPPPDPNDWPKSTLPELI
jgi:hypothetical protein